MSHKYLVLSGGTSGKELPCQCRRCKRYRFHPWVRKIPWRRHGNTLQYSCLDNSMDRGAWQATVHGITQNQIQLKQLSTAHMHYKTIDDSAFQKTVARHSSQISALLTWELSVKKLTHEKKNAITKLIFLTALGLLKKWAVQKRVFI